MSEVARIRTTATVLAVVVLLAGCDSGLWDEESARDDAITTQVRVALLRDRTIASTDIHVETDHGQITLSGSVPTEYDARRVQAIARAIEGAKRVFSKLTVIQSYPVRPQPRRIWA